MCVLTAYSSLMVVEKYPGGGESTSYNSLKGEAAPKENTFNVLASGPSFSKVD